MTQNINY